jgi:hypothetical protein
MCFPRTSRVFILISYIKSPGSRPAFLKGGRILATKTQKALRACAKGSKRNDRITCDDIFFICTACIAKKYGAHIVRIICLFLHVPFAQARLAPFVFWRLRKRSFKKTARFFMGPSFALPFPGTLLHSRRAITPQFTSMPRQESLHNYRMLLYMESNFT